MKLCSFDKFLVDDGNFIWLGCGTGYQLPTVPEVAAQDLLSVVRWAAEMRAPMNATLLLHLEYGNLLDALLLYLGKSGLARELAASESDITRGAQVGAALASLSDCV
eukprot:COSAG02_NODE_27165_length_615_cov_2.176357_2_plen_107_part_00